MTCGFIKCVDMATQWHNNNKGGNQKCSTRIFSVHCLSPIFHLISPNLRPFQGQERRNVKKYSNLPYITIIGFRQKKFLDSNYFHGSLIICPYF